MENNDPNVLIVDEDDSFLDTAAVLLESLGYRVVTTRSGDEALAILQTCPSIAALLTDIVLPGTVGGPDLAHLAKAVNPRIAIVYTTRYSPMLLLDSEAPRDGMLLRKAWDRDELKAALSKALESASVVGYTGDE